MNTNRLLSIAAAGLALVISSKQAANAEPQARAASSSAGSGSPAGNLILDTRSLGNDGIGNFYSTGFFWGAGYPSVDISVDTDESLVFFDGVQRQGLGDWTIPAASSELDHPVFTSLYPGNLELSTLFIDSGTMSLTYTFEFPIRWVDIVLVDIDESDVARVEIFDETGLSISPTNLYEVVAGDHSLTQNSPGRPANEEATPPIWDPTDGTLAAAVTWGEHRSFTVIRPRVPVSRIRITGTGHRVAPNVTSTGSLLFAALWATPRSLEISQVTLHSPTELLITWPSLPGLNYRVLGTSDFVTWTEEASVQGATSPGSQTQVAVPRSSGSRFYRVEW